MKPFKSVISQKTTHNKEYKIVTKDQDPYSEEGYNWQNKNMPNHKYRSYKTWKYNRKKQYK